MGRGRAKAKQTKVARDLKYRTHETDFGELAKELHGGAGSAPPREPVEAPFDVGPDVGDVDDYDTWADYSGPSRRD